MTTHFNSNKPHSLHFQNLFFNQSRSQINPNSISEGSKHTKLTATKQNITMTTSTTRDRIETVIFTPTTSFDCCVGCDDDSGYYHARERSVSYETMEELKDKLFLMYEEDEQENTCHAHQHQTQFQESEAANQECREENEAENCEDDDDLLVATSSTTSPPLRSILKNKYPTASCSTTNNHHDSSSSSNKTPPSSPRLPATGSTPSTKKRVRSPPTKKKNRLVRFVISSSNSKTNL